MAGNRDAGKSGTWASGSFLREGEEGRRGEMQARIHAASTASTAIHTTLSHTTRSHFAHQFGVCASAALLLIYSTPTVISPGHCPSYDSGCSRPCCASLRAYLRAFFAPVGEVWRPEDVKSVSREGFRGWWLVVLVCWYVLDCLRQRMPVDRISCLAGPLKQKLRIGSNQYFINLSSCANCGIGDWHRQRSIVSLPIFCWEADTR
ncbi:hypothetical protein F5884DRAFT_89933 [Xylogone sp. PMI_703]|nr:hypothetical protein F5884DRAFT_89933 [Xylogone sp. PMI_703]